MLDSFFEEIFASDRRAEKTQKHSHVSLHWIRDNFYAGLYYFTMIYSTVDYKNYHDYIYFRPRRTRSIII